MSLPPSHNRLVRVHFDEQRRSIFERTDRLIASLLQLQWIGLVVLGFYVSAGPAAASALRIHSPAWVALLAGGIIVLPCAWLALKRPGAAMTRHAIAVGQMLVSVLLIHIAGGRLGSYFHSFGSLALLSLYRDWRVLLSAVTVVAGGRLAADAWLPSAARGLLESAGEQIAWILFESIFLVHACRVGVREMWKAADRQVRLTHEAQHDPLTGLPNRALLEDRITSAVMQAHRNGVRLAILYVDIDRFKSVNDTFGHRAGDILLRQVGRRISSSLRECDTVARVGADEFVIVLNGIGSEHGARTVAEKLVAGLRSEFLVDGQQILVSASIGVALHPDHATEATALVKSSAHAMQRAKRRGRNCCEVFDGEHEAVNREQLILESDLHRALERSEFELHYQPEFDRSGRFAAFEALVRWRHPKRGLIGPDRFIPLAEDSGLIIPLGEWVLFEACRQNACWQQAGGGRVKMAVNVSPLQLARDNFTAKVAEALEASGLDGRLLELELTESMLVNGFAESVKQMEQLRSLGVGISIDDFGSGYSSLGYLQQLPVDTLKIDRSFVSRLETSSTTQPMLKAIVKLAHDLGMTVVAEGIETDSQRRAAWDMGCDRIQGFLLGRPVPAADAFLLLTRHSLLDSDAIAV